MYNPETQYQTIYITLDDGREVVSTAPAFCDVGDAPAITGIRISPPKDLEPDEHWVERVHNG